MEIDTCTKDILEVALVEFPPVWDNASASLSALEGIFRKMFSVENAATPDIVVLPEFFAVGFTMNPDAAEPSGNSATLGWMEKMSAEFGCAVAGSVPIAESGKRFNRMFFVQPSSCDGAHGCSGAVQVDSYDKAHLFFGGEDENYVPGKERRVFRFKGWRIMPGICFDLRFPEWARNFREEPYDIYLNVANWPVARNAAAEVLIKARSIENVCWTVFCNRTGSDNLLEYSGNSAVIDYRGRSRGRRIEVEGVPVLYARIEKEPMYRFRRNFPILDLIEND